MAKLKTAIVAASFSRPALRKLDAFANSRNISVSKVLRGIILRGLAAGEVPSEMTASTPLTGGIKSLRVPIEVKTQLERMATGQGCTVSALIRSFVEDEFTGIVGQPRSASQDGRFLPDPFQTTAISRQAD